MREIVEMITELKLDPATGEKIKQFTGEGLLVGSIGLTELSYRNDNEIEKRYRLATAKVNIKGLGERSLLLQVHEGNLKGMVGLKKEDEWEYEGQIDDAIEGFVSGESYFTTVRLVKKTNGEGMTLLGNISHLKFQEGLEKFTGVYRFINNDLNAQEFYLIILDSSYALFLYEESKEKINLNSILDVYEESYDTYEEMVIDFKNKKNESTLNLLLIKDIEANTIRLESRYHKLFGFSTYQCLKIEAKLNDSISDNDGLSSLSLSMYSSHKETLNGNEIQKTKILAQASFSKFA